MPIDDKTRPSPPPGGCQFNLKFLLGAVLVCCLLLAVFVPAFQAARESERRTNCTNSCKQIGIGFYGYHDVMMADGSVRFLPDDTASGVVRSLLTAAGGEKAAP